jgi:hypothetical protein
MGGVFRKPKKRTEPVPPAPRREETAKKTAPEQKKPEQTRKRGDRLSRSISGGQLLGYQPGGVLGSVRNPRA